MWSLPETLMVILGGLLAAWGMSLVARAKPARRHRRGRCADCNARLPGVVRSAPASSSSEAQANAPSSEVAAASTGPDTAGDPQRNELDGSPDLPAFLPPPSPCPRCTSDTSRHHMAGLNHSARWTIPGLLIIALGLACPWWSLPLLGAATGTSALLTPTFGLVSGIAVVLSGLAVAIFVAGLLSDPSTGRPRCRRCWYPIAAALPATCPECGRVATAPAHLYRTRRRRLPMALGVVVLLVAQVGWFEPFVRRNGLVSLVPTNILINSIGFVPSDWIVTPPLTAAQAQAQAAALNGGWTYYTPAGSTTISANGSVISSGGVVVINGRPVFTGVMPAAAAPLDHTLTGRIHRQQLTAEQLKRVRVVAMSRVASSHSIRSMQATLDLIHLATFATPASPGGAASAASAQPTPSSAVNSWPPMPQGSTLTALGSPSAPPAPTPELDAAYARALTVVIRELGGSDGRSAAALTWVLSRASNLALTHRRPRLALPEFAEALASARGDLQRLAASPRDSTAAGALMLLAVSGQAGPDRLPRLAELLASADPLAVDAAEMAMGAIALHSPEARVLWAQARPLGAQGRTNAAPELTGGYAIDEIAYTASPDAMTSPVAYTLGAGWRAWLTPQGAAPALLTLDQSGRISTWHHWAFLRSLARAEPEFLGELVAFGLANPDSTKAIAVFNGLQDVRFRFLSRWPLLLRAEHSMYAQNSVLELLYAATAKEPAGVMAHLDLLAEYADAMQRRIESDPSVNPDDHRYNGLARARALIQWIEEEAAARASDPE